MADSYLSHHSLQEPWETNDDHHSQSLLCARNYARPCVHVILTIADEKISSERRSNLLKVIQQNYGV